MFIIAPKQLDTLHLSVHFGPDNDPECDASVLPPRNVSA